MSVAKRRNVARKRRSSLDTLATFQRRVDVDDYGPETDPWRDAFREWVGYEPLSTSQRIAAAQLVEGQTGVLTMHYRDDVDATMRCVDDKGRVYEFLGEPIDDGDSQEFLLVDVAISTNRGLVRRLAQS